MVGLVLSIDTIVIIKYNILGGTLTCMVIVFGYISIHSELITPNHGNCLLQKQLLPQSARGTS